MFAIAFDMTVAEIERLHPRNVQAGYLVIARVLGLYGFRWRQGSLYVADDEDLAKLFQAIHALKALPWFPAAVWDIRAFRVEQWSDFTKSMKQ